MTVSQTEETAGQIDETVGQIDETASQIDETASQNYKTSCPINTSKIGNTGNHIYGCWPNRSDYSAK